MSVRLYIGNLPKEEVDRQELQAVFAEMGDSVNAKVIKDRKTGKCRGFGFVTVNDDEQADLLIEKFNGSMFKDIPLKIEKALPRSKGQGDEDSAQPSSDAPITEATPSNVERSVPRRSGSNKKPRRGPVTSTSTATDNDAIQPDPRWASELEKLKQMLAAQTTN